MSWAGAEHGVVIAELTMLLGQHIHQQNWGYLFGAGTGFVLARNPDTVRAPDIAFVRQEWISLTGIPRSYFPGAPDLAVEVVSPTDRPNAIDAKLADWLAHGCQSVWIVDPRSRLVAVHRPQQATLQLGENDLLEEPTLLTEFQTVVGTIFPVA